MDWPGLAVKTFRLGFFSSLQTINRLLQKLLTNWKYVNHRMSAAFAAHEVDWVEEYIDLLFLEGLKTLTSVVWGARRKVLMLFG